MNHQLINGVDISTVTSSKDLYDLLDQVEDFELRKQIRQRLKEVKDGEKEERNAFFNRLENQREMSIQKKMQDTMQEKQRYLNMYDNMAKQPAGDKKSLDISLYKDNSKKVTSAKDKFKMMDQQATVSKPSSFASNSPASIKDNILKWCAFKTRGYQHVNITGYSTSFCDGMAFCALIHHYFPDAFDYNSLDPKNRRFNLELAFKVAEERADIAPLLDVNDMIMMKNKADPKSIFCYLSEVFRKLRKLD